MRACVFACVQFSANTDPENAATNMFFPPVYGRYGLHSSLGMQYTPISVHRSVRVCV